MLRSLKLKNVGPIPALTIEFGDRLTLLTGDNGLGKSFLLDIAWWALTRSWPNEVNPKMTSGAIARPSEKGPATIETLITAQTKEVKEKNEYDRENETWGIRAGRPSNPGLVLYAMADGSFSVWDPARNNFKKNKKDQDEGSPPFVFTPSDIWQTPENIPGCNGILLDWWAWQIENGKAFQELTQVLESLSPSPDEKITIGEFVNISVSDPRDKPTIRMPYAQDVPLPHLSSGLRRIVTLAYLLVWTWEMHRRASKILGKATTHQITFLFDEIEAHLHPRWQQSIVTSLIRVMEQLTDAPKIQLITSTHSPLVMASMETIFDKDQDKWYDFDFLPKEQKITLTNRPLTPQGEISNWLTSDAFDLPTSRNPIIAKQIDDFSRLIDSNLATPAKVKAQYEEIAKNMNPTDVFLFRARALCEGKGLL